MNYLDVRERQVSSYFIICIYFNEEEKSMESFFLQDFNYYFLKNNSLNCCLLSFSSFHFYSILGAILFKDILFVSPFNSQ